MVSRREFIAASGGAIAALPFLNLARNVFADDLPDVIKNSKAQFYNGLRQFVSGEGALTKDQNIVLTNTIYPFDLDLETPYFNQELFRTYADRSFSRGIEEAILPNPQGYTTGRVSYNYKNLMDIVTSRVDQNHPEIKSSMQALEKELDKAVSDYDDKVTRLDNSWNEIAATRKLDPKSSEYRAEYIAWASGVLYADQQAYYTSKIATVLSKMNATRRKVYKNFEIAVLENNENLLVANHIVRPWYAQTERSAKAEGDTLTDLKLADPHRYTPALFDRSPLIAPDGDLAQFMAVKSDFKFGTNHTDYHLDQGASSWTASTGGGFLWWHASGGGSGSSSFSHTATNAVSFEVRFDGLAEYLINRGPWFSPAVFLDKNVEKTIKDRYERDYLQYVAVSLILARGTTLEVKFSKTTDNQDWSESSFQAAGGVSLFGFSWGARGGNSSNHYTVTRSTDGLTVTMKDDSNVARVLGARVEPFLTPVPKAIPTGNLFDYVIPGGPGHKISLDDVKAGRISYIEFMKARNAALKMK